MKTYAISCIYYTTIPVGTQGNLYKMKKAAQAVERPSSIKFFTSDNVISHATEAGKENHTYYTDIWRKGQEPKIETGRGICYMKESPTGRMERGSRIAARGIIPYTDPESQQKRSWES